MLQNIEGTASWLVLIQDYDDNDDGNSTSNNDVAVSSFLAQLTNTQLFSCFPNVKNVKQTIIESVTQQTKRACCEGCKAL